jgi:hypothetical protein
MNRMPVTAGEIQSIIRSLKAKDSCGYDGISAKILNMCNSLISMPLSYISNKSIQSGVFPDPFKYASVMPLFKKGNWSSISNYRPLSLLPEFSKLLEKTINSRVNQHLV